jgi:hypothetical protein
VKRLFIKSAAVALLALSCLGCDARLPDPESPGAVLYAQRCNGCHRLYAPSLMKAAMWNVMLDRMQGEMVRRGLPPLTAEERKTVMAYLEKHSSP